MSAKKSLHLALLVTLLSLSGVVSASATPITILNGSFENGTMVNPGGFDTLTAGDTSIDDWTISAGTIDYIGGYWEAADGDRSLDMNGISQGFIQQAITVPFDGNVRIDFSMAGNPDDLNKIKHLTVSLKNPDQVFTFDATGKGHQTMGWVNKYAVFTGVTAGAWTLEFQGGVNEAQYGPALDNISASVPDGGTTAALLGLAMTGLGLIRRMRA